MTFTTRQPHPSACTCCMALCFTAPDQSLTHKTTECGGGHSSHSSVSPSQIHMALLGETFAGEHLAKMLSSVREKLGNKGKKNICLISDPCHGNCFLTADEINTNPCLALSASPPQRSHLASCASYKIDSQSPK